MDGGGRPRQEQAVETNYRDVKITYALGDIASRNALRTSK